MGNGTTVLEPTDFLTILQLLCIGYREGVLEMICFNENSKNMENLSTRKKKNTPQVFNGECRVANFEDVLKVQ